MEPLINGLFPIFGLGEDEKTRDSEQSYQAPLRPKMDDLSLVSQYLSGNEAGKVVDALSNPDPNVLERARELYVAHRGRLPSPPLPAPLQPSET